MAGFDQQLSAGSPWDLSVEALTACARAGGPDQDRTEGRLARLARTIESDIIPRLVLAHRNIGTPSATVADSFYPRTIDAEDFAALALRHDTATLLDHVEEVVDHGVPLEAVLLDLLAPAARHLGEQWVQDQCDFTAVTLGLWRLQQVLHALCDRHVVGCAPPRAYRRALLAPLPGDQHTFGLSMVAEFFRRDGWAVLDGPFPDRNHLIALVQREVFEVVGLSIGSSGGVAALSSLIDDLRRSAANTNLCIMVGGPIFLQFPELVRRVGADATAGDGREAVQQAEALVTGATVGP